MPGRRSRDSRLSMHGYVTRPAVHRDSRTVTSLLLSLKPWRRDRVSRSQPRDTPAAATRVDAQRQPAPSRLEIVSTADRGLAGKYSRRLGMKVTRALLSKPASLGGRKRFRYGASCRAQRVLQSSPTTEHYENKSPFTRRLYRHASSSLLRVPQPACFRRASVPYGTCSV